MADIESINAAATAAVKQDVTARKVEKFADKAAAPVAKFAEAGQAFAAESAEAVTAKAEVGLKDTQEALTQGYHKAADAARGAVDTQREAIETAVKASQIYNEGLQSLASQAAELAKTHYEDTVAHLRALAAVKSVREAMELQTAFARATLSRALTEGTNFAENYFKVAEKALAPVTAHVRETAEKVKTAA